MGDEKAMQSRQRRLMGSTGNKSAARWKRVLLVSAVLSVSAAVLLGCAAPSRPASGVETPEEAKKASAADASDKTGQASNAGTPNADTFEETPQETPQETKQISTMEDYNSRFDPSHIDSREAREMYISNENAVVLDVRSEASYIENHVSVAVNVPFEQVKDFAESNLPDKDTVIICYCFCDDKGGSALSACRLLSDMGYTRAFYTEPGDEWTYAGTANSSITGAQAKEIYDSQNGVILLDVRNPDEYEAEHIEGSVLIPVTELEARLSELPDKHAVIIVYCRGGVRSSNAFKILSDNGYVNVYDMQKVSNWPEPLATG